MALARPWRDGGREGLSGPKPNHFLTDFRLHGFTVQAEEPMTVNEEAPVAGLRG